MLRYHFFNAGKGYLADNMFDAAGVFFRNIVGYMKDVGEKYGQCFMPVQYGSGFFQAVFGKYDAPVRLHDDIPVLFQDAHCPGYAGFGKIHFGGNINRADVSVTLL